MPAERKTPKRTWWSGQVSIAEEVVSSIASIAAQEVEGVSKRKGTVANGLAALLSSEKRRGVAAQLSEDRTIRIRLKAVIRYGYPIYEVAKNIQAKVKQEVEGMTGLHVSAVDVYVQELEIDETPSPLKEAQS